MAEKIYFGSLKGGTGVTTVCVGLGLALADSGERTLIVDGDVTAACPMTVAGLGDYQVYTLADYEKGACRAKQAAFTHPKAQNLSIMPATGIKDLSVIKSAVKEIEGLYDYVLLDKAAAESCDLAVAVTEPYIPSLKSAGAFTAALSDGGAKDVRIIVNKLNGGKVAAGEVLSAQQISKLLRVPLLAQIPEDCTLPAGRWKQSTVAAFKVAANTLTGKKCDMYDVLKGYSGFNGFIKRKLRERI